MALTGKKATVYNLVLAAANTEYSFAVPTGTKKILFHCRTDDTLKFSYAEGESGSVYSTLPEGASQSDDDLNTAPGFTIYFQSASVGVVVEITIWET